MLLSWMQESMLVVLNELKMALMETIDAKDWLDNSTKQHALKKAQRINEFLAYPKEIENTTYLDNFYSKVCSLKAIACCKFPL